MRKGEVMINSRINPNGTEMNRMYRSKTTDLSFLSNFINMFSLSGNALVWYSLTGRALTYRIFCRNAKHLFKSPEGAYPIPTTKLRFCRRQDGVTVEKRLA